LIDFGLAQQCQLKGLNESKRFPPVHVIVTIAATEKTQLIEALRLGAHGVLLKRSKQEMLLKSFRGVMAGQYWLERDTVGVLVEVLRDSLAQANGTKSPKDYGLTRREIDIITKIASGRSNKEVGEEFAISERTVKHHLTNIFGKVGVTSRLQLALFAVNQNFMGHPGPPLLLPTMQQDDEL
jgi:DNA-binding NarL/FixJ family response regulator